MTVTGTGYGARAGKLAAFAAAALVAILASSCATTRTAAIKAPNAVSSLEYIKVGGVDQLVLARGEDASKPILLYVHGGPGMPGIPFEHELRELEKDFIVVFWDQRGTGRSYPKTVEPVSMGLIVDDAKELIDILLARYGKGKLYLVGHSWGSVIGLKVAHECPGKLYAYIGVGQMTDIRRNETLGYEFAVGKAREAGDAKALAELGKVRPPYLDASGRLAMGDLQAERQLLEKFGGIYYDKSRFGGERLKDIMLASTEYSLGDFMSMGERSQAIVGDCWRDLVAVDFFREAPRLEVPVWFFMGVADRNASYDLCRQYCDALDAPAGKRFVSFERSGHFPFLEERDAFVAEVRKAAAAAPGK